MKYGLYFLPGSLCIGSLPCPVSLFHPSLVLLEFNSQMTYLHSSLVTVSASGRGPPYEPTEFTREKGHLLVQESTVSPSTFSDTQGHLCSENINCKIPEINNIYDLSCTLL